MYSARIRALKCFFFLVFFSSFFFFLLLDIHELGKCCSVISLISNGCFATFCSRGKITNAVIMEIKEFVWTVCSRGLVVNTVSVSLVKAPTPVSASEEGKKKGVIRIPFINITYAVVFVNRGVEKMIRRRAGTGMMFTQTLCLFMVAHTKDERRKLRYNRVLITYPT